MRLCKYQRPGKDGRMMVWTGTTWDYRYHLVMEAHLGRPLAAGECVHHLNEDPTDDRLENLELCASNAEHKLAHHSHVYGMFACLTCGKEHRGERRRKHHYCSRECWKAGCAKIGGRPVSTGAGLAYDLTCEQCGTAFTRKGRHKHAFCSHGCYALWLRGKTRSQVTAS